MSDNRWILVADDDPGVRDLIRTYLDGAGYEVYSARDGVEAVSRVHELQPGALILDINMPRTSDKNKTRETL